MPAPSPYNEGRGTRHARIPRGIWALPHLGLLPRRQTLYPSVNPHPCRSPGRFRARESRGNRRQCPECACHRARSLPLYAAKCTRPEGQPSERRAPSQGEKRQQSRSRRSRESCSQRRWRYPGLLDTPRIRLPGLMGGLVA